jgi:signal transduction histidine kinase
LRLDLAAVPPVAAAPGVIDQALDNLIANAIAVAPAGSAITLAAHRAGGMVELHVIDQGPGMTETQRRRAFDRFWRAGTTDHDGFGLGLPIVQRLMTASGGTVDLRDAPGGGLDAVIRLPPARPDVRPHDEPAAATPSRKTP